VRSETYVQPHPEQPFINPLSTRFVQTALKLDYVPAVLWRELERPRNRVPTGAFLFNLI
jgi:hypothetical protein